METPVDRVIDNAYAAAAGEKGWTDVAAGLAGLVGAAAGVVLGGDFYNGAFDFLVASGLDRGDLVPYERHWRPHDPWIPVGAGALTGRVCHGWQAVAESSLVRTAFYCDYGRALGLHHMLATLAEAGPGLVIGFGMSRPAGSAPFTEEERRRLEPALPHLRRAAQLNRRLAAAGAAPPRGELGFAALDALAAGVVLVGLDGLVAYTNGAAEALARAGDGVLLGARGERRQLDAAHPQDRAALRDAVQDVLAGGAGAAVGLRRPSGAPPLAALVSPMPTRFADAATKHPRMAAVFLSPLDAPGPAPEVLEALFGMGAAEAQVVAELAAGATAQAVAKRRGVSEATVRTQVRRALEKAGAGNLRQLARMAALAALVGRQREEKHASSA